MENLGEFVCVELKTEDKENGLVSGTKGTIVFEYRTKNKYLVEFFDENKKTIGVFTVSGDNLKVR